MGINVSLTNPSNEAILLLSVHSSKKLLSVTSFVFKSKRVILELGIFWALLLQDNKTYETNTLITRVLAAQNVLQVQEWHTCLFYHTQNTFIIIAGAMSVHKKYMQLSNSPVVPQ